MKTPLVTEDEIANAAGMSDTHSGVNFMRAACIIAMEKVSTYCTIFNKYTVSLKAQTSFDPMLEALKHRATHVMKRLFPIVENMINQVVTSSPLDAYNRPFQEMVQ